MWTLIGERIRPRRHRVGMTQAGLAEAIGLTFQQVQKYEKGSNRVAASVLFTVARALDVPITYFYDGLGATELPPAAELVTRKQGLLLRGAASMPDEVREAFIGLASAFAKGEPRLFRFSPFVGDRAPGSSVRAGSGRWARS